MANHSSLRLAALCSVMLVTSAGYAQTAEGWPDAPPPPPTPPQKERAYDVFDGTNPFIGMGFKPGIGLLLDHASGGSSDAEFAFLWSLRGGVLFDRTELSLEIAPVTARSFWPGSDPNLSALLNFGIHLPLGGPVNWPFRVGAGVTAVNFISDAAFQSRLDAIGISINFSHFLIDIFVPSLRHHTDFDAYGLINFYFGVDAVYVF